VTADEFRLLKKLMTMAAGTDNDAESVAHFRAATKIIARNGFTWDMALSKVITVMDLGDLGEPSSEPIQDQIGEREHVRAPMPPVQPPRRVAQQLSERHAGLDRDFELAMDSASGSFLDVLEDIHAQWETKGYLSDRQLEVVRDAAERASERHPGGRVR